MEFKEEKKIIDFYHLNTNNYKDQTLYEKGYSYKLSNNINLSNHYKDIKEPKEKTSFIMPDLKSGRDFSLKSVSIDSLIELLRSSYNINSDGLISKSKTPSAGGLYPIELYLIIRNVKGANNGTYLYNRYTSDLNYINSFDDIESLNVPNNSFVKNSAFLLYFVANIENIVKKYGARGYRFCLIECGHIGQNFALVANKMNLKSCAVGGFFDLKVKQKLNLKQNFYPLYSYAFGGWGNKSE